jgi:hypothetical protein
MPEVELPLDISLTPVTVAYVLIVGFITEVIMKVTPKGFDKERFGQLISLGVALVVSVIDGIATHLGICVILVRGAIWSFLSNGGYDAVKSVAAHVKTRGA